MIVAFIRSVAHPPGAGLDSEPADVRAQMVSLATHSLFVEAANSTVSVVASPQQGLELKAAMGASTRALRTLRTWLISFGVSVMPSEKAIRKHAAALLAGKEWDVGSHGIPDTDDQFAFTRLKDVTAVLTSHVQRMFDDGQLVWASGQPLHRLQVVLTGDKGGTATKLQLQFCNTREPQAERSCLLLGMYEATDSYENIQAVFAPLLQELAAAVKAFTLNRTLANVAAVPLPLELPVYRSARCHRCVVPPATGTDTAPTCPTVVTIKGIDVLLGGDIAWLHTITGLSTCAGRYFCCVCDLTREQLHDDGPAVVGALRTYDDNVGRAAAYENAGRPKEEMKKEMYKNCINAPLVPLDLAFAPPILHIVMGIVGKCVKRLLYVTHVLDNAVAEQELVDMSEEAEAYRKELRAAENTRVLIQRSDALAVEAMAAVQLALERKAAPAEMTTVRAYETMMVKVVNNRKAEFVEQTAALTSAKATLARAHAEATKAQPHGVGPFTLAVLRRFREYGVVMQPQHGGTLNGESCVRMLTNHLLIVACLNERPLHTATGQTVMMGDVRAQTALLAVLGPLQTIGTLGLRATPLCEHERALLNSDIQRFHKQWRQFFPREGDEEKKERQRETANEEKKRKGQVEDWKRRKQARATEAKRDQEDAKAEEPVKSEGKGAGKKQERDDRKKRRREEAKEDKEEREEEDDEGEGKKRPKQAKLEVMLPTPKSHWLWHVVNFVNRYHSV